MLKNCVILTTPHFVHSKLKLPSMFLLTVSFKLWLLAFDV